MNAILAILALLSIPITLMNILGGIISGIWLAIIGEWDVILLGLLSFFIGIFIISLALLPRLIFGIPALRLINQGKVLMGIIIGTPSAIYTILVMVAWCFLVFYSFDSTAEGYTRVPMLMWSYGIATGPWLYLAQQDVKESGEGFNPSAINMFFISVGYFLMIFMTLIFNVSLQTALLYLYISMTISFLLQFVSMVVFLQQNQQ